MRNLLQVLGMLLAAVLVSFLPACDESSEDDVEVEEELSSVKSHHQDRANPIPTNAVPETPSDPLASLCLPAWVPAPEQIDILVNSTNRIETLTEIMPFPDGSAITNIYQETLAATLTTMTFADGTVYVNQQQYESFLTRTPTNETFIEDGNTDETLTAPDGALCTANEIISTVPGSSPATQFTANVECPGGAVTVIDRATYNRIKAKLGL